MSQYAAALLVSVLIGFAMGAGVMFHFRGPPVTVTAEVSVPYPVTLTVPSTVLRTTTSVTTLPVTLTRTATLLNTTTRTVTGFVTNTTTLTLTATRVLTTTVNHTTIRTATLQTTVTTTVLTTATVTSTTTATATTTTTVTVRPETVTCFSRTQDCVSLIVSLINRANVSVNVAVYVFTNPQLADALVAADRRGVRVIVVVETNNANITGSQVGYLAANGVEVVLDDNPYLMHHKFAIVDGLYVIVGSYNWSIAAEERNDESILIIRDPEIASRFQQEFNRLLLEAGYD